MLIERCAYANRWRSVTPAAKALFALCALIAAFLARRPQAAGMLALILATITCMGARIRPLDYLRAATPALLFLGTGCVTLLFSVHASPGGIPQFAWAPDASQQVAHLLGRSLAALASLLLLVLTTPLPDFIALLRRLRLPDLLLDLMVLCYRMLFVFSTALRDITSAQAARLGYATPRLALRSAGVLAANLTLQVWQRSAALHTAALARANDGPLRFLSPQFPHPRRDTALAAIAGILILGLGALA